MPLPETRLLLAHAAQWETDAVVLGAPSSELEQLGLDALSPIPDHEREHEACVLYWPKARRRREYFVALGAATAKTLVVVGHKRSGIKSASKMLTSLGRIRTKEHGCHCQLLVLELSARAPLPQFKCWESSFEARDLKLVSLPGVFCDGRLDDASDLLLDHFEPPEVGSLLDLGCGAGVLGLWAKRASPALCVTLSDVDSLAVESSRRSAGYNQLEVRCVVSDVYSALHERFDVIVTNPPFHQGVATDYDVTRRIISESPAHLTSRGELWLVANHFLPWRQCLEQHFGEVELVHASRRFKIWRARAARSS
ncbi:MAG: class I SAM-dependent methyltransferase [Deltaproteobacteria bacterium]|nr:class I SAM-dependent methyltransferase [Deltaproteobacteria bacterium]